MALREELDGIDEEPTTASEGLLLANTPLGDQGTSRTPANASSRTTNDLTSTHTLAAGRR